ncbi:MAG: hypothetical protein ABSB88_06025 [Bryobacteraceae bacterium]|jgi:hypothetical protein
MDTQQFVKDFRALANQIADTVERKNADYSHSDADPFRNFLYIENLAAGRVSAADGILVRMSDKMMRISNLIAPGVVEAVEGEKVDDTCVDLAAYALILALLLRSRR